MSLQATATQHKEVQKSCRGNRTSTLGAEIQPVLHLPSAAPKGLHLGAYF